MLGFLLLSSHAHAQEEQKTEEVPIAPVAAKPIPAAPVPTATIPAASTAESKVVPVKPWLSEGTERTVAPDVYLLPDESGQLRKVLGFKYEDFLKAWKLAGDGNEPTASARRPRFVVDAWKITGKVLETHAQLRMEFEITVQANGWIDVPLQLPAFIIQKLTIENQVEGECLVFDEKNHGHVAWLSGKMGQKRKLVLEGLVRLKLNADNHGIEMYVPRATSTEFLLQVPITFARFEKSPESTLTTTLVNEDAIELRLVGQANPLRLSWKPAEEKAVNKASLLEVEGQTKVQLDRRQILYTTTLEVNSFDRLLGQVQVRLPRGAKLIAGENSGEHEIREVSTPSSSNAGQVVSIRRTQPQTKPWTISLSAEASWAPAGDRDGKFDEHFIEGFEVLDAFRQSGTVLIEVDKRLQAYFDTHDEIDQIRVPKTTVASESRLILGQFRYTRFPWHLTAFTSPRLRRVSVRPKYELSLSGEEARLTVTCDYQFTGAEIFMVRVNLQDWVSTGAAIDSGGQINSDGILFQNTGNVILPLVDPSTPKLQLILELRKDMQLGENTFDLPEFLDAFVDDSELIVESSESLIVTPKFGEMVGLSVLSKTMGEIVDPSERIFGIEKERIRLRTFLPQPKFVVDVKHRKRQLVVAGKTTVEMDQQLVHVQQRLNYTSKYQPVSELSLTLPEAMWLNETLIVSLNGKRLPVDLGPPSSEKISAKISTEITAEKSPVLLPIVVTLPRSMQNKIPLEISYEVPAPVWKVGEWTPLRLPLAAPQLAKNPQTVVVRAAPPVLVTANQRSSSDAWQIILEKNRVAKADEDALQMQTNEKLFFLSLHTQLDSTEKEQLATLERTWIQSWVTAGQRQDRAVFRFRSAYATVVAQLPQALNSSGIEVLLDHVPQSVEMLEGNRLSVVLPADGQRASHTLELRYQTPAVLPSWGELDFSLPRLECHETNAPSYWQLILPRHWLLASAPAELNAEYWLGWKNYRWGRQSTFSQADLEQRTSGVPADSPPEQSTQYVFRAFEIPAEIQVTVLRQSWLLLFGSLIVFGIGLLCLYTPVARSGLFWLGLALASLMGVFSYPEMTLLVIEVILVGGLLTFVTSLLRRVFVVKVNGATAPRNTEPVPEVTESWQQHKLIGGDEGAGHSETTATLLRTDRPPS